MGNGAQAPGFGRNALRMRGALCWRRDITKLRHNDIKEYIGMDIANQAIERASQKLSDQSEIKGDVIAFNAFSAIAGHMLEKMRSFDIVSCQFAIHHAFSDERTARS